MVLYFDFVLLYDQGVRKSGLEESSLGECDNLLF